MLKKIIGTVLISWASIVSAMMPEGGIWWNPSEPGSGYTIEIQDNILAISAYSYDLAGNATWYTSAGPMNRDNRYNGSLSRFTGGQCIGCPYRFPSAAIPAGTVDIAFDTPGTATLTINGTRVTRIKRFYYGVGESAPYAILGEWSLVSGSSLFPVYFGDRVSLSSTFPFQGSLHATGYRTGSTTNLVTSATDPDGVWSLLIDSSSSYYSFYQFRFSGLNAISGTNWTFLKSQNLSGSGLPFVGFRSGSLSSLTSSGPALPRSELVSPGPDIDYDSANAAKASLHTSGRLTPDEALATERAVRMVNELLGR